MFDTKKVFGHLMTDVRGAVVVIPNSGSELFKRHLVILMAFRQTTLSGSKVSEGVQNSASTAWNLELCNLRACGMSSYRNETLSILPNIASCFDNAQLRTSSAALYFSWNV